jgi:8-oxo-dGTP pyrophosphatase MutT (NUDIX family)
MSKPPFKLNQRKTACENSLFTVFFDHLVDADKTLVEDYLVVEPKIKYENGISGVAILPVKDNRFGLVNVYRHPVAAYGWEVPRGFIDNNESLEDAAIRELKEETGLTCARSDLQSLGTISPEPGIISAKVILYTANITNSKNNEIENELGHVEFRWFTNREVTKLIHDQLMSDATTLTAYFKSVFPE